MKTFIIAEAGVNHEGDFDKALKMIETAKLCGADAIKFQTFWDIGKILKKYEFTKEQWITLKKEAEKKGIEFMTTPHWGSPLSFYKKEDYDVIDFVDMIVKRHKVASPYLVNKKYLTYIANKRKPLIISTGSINHKSGIATLSEIKRSLEWIKDSDITLLYCVSKYPCLEFDKKRIKELKRFGYPVGISDHTTETVFEHYPVIEKHFMIDTNCIDANVSIGPMGLSLLVENQRNYEKISKKVGKTKHKAS